MVEKERKKIAWFPSIIEYESDCSRIIRKVDLQVIDMSLTYGLLR